MASNTSKTRQVKEVKKAVSVPSVLKERINISSVNHVEVNDEESIVIKRFARLNRLTKKYKKIYEEMKDNVFKVFDNYLTGKDIDKLAHKVEDKYFELIADSDIVRLGLSLERQIDNDQALQVAISKGLLSKVATVSATELKKYLTEEEYAELVIEETIGTRLTIGKR